MRPLFQKFCGFSAFLVAIGGVASDKQMLAADSFEPHRLAQESAVIRDDLAENEYIYFVWVTPPTINPNVEGSALLKQFLRQFNVVGFNHIRLTEAEGIAIVRAESPKFRTAEGKPVEAFVEAEMPPNLLEKVKLIRSTFANNLPEVGPSMRWFWFKDRDLDSCAEGGISITYLDRTYVFEAPMPGC
ncbi:MAG: hypothetical protein R8L07_05385 [Alphaproteobacteria bacterium]|nr:hypothetical protein [Alphaproteobacteria bacterium]